MRRWVLRDWWLVRGADTSIALRLTTEPRQAVFGVTWSRGPGSLSVYLWLPFLCLRLWWHG